MDIFAPCQLSCPLEVDVPTYIGLVAQGKFKEALDIIREENPLPSVCGCVCHHPCEDDCRRSKIDQAIAIATIKRAAAEYGYTTPNPLPIKYQKKIAIVGGGPAGLSAAYHLLKLGYPVEIFERHKKLGGMLAQCIPQYRLPQEILDKDIDYLLRLGIEAHTQVEIDTAKLSLLKEEYDAVILAVGLPLSKTLDIGQDELPQVLLALDILRKLNSQQNLVIYGRIVVIGGGNVAIDVARSLWRLPNVDEIIIICLESESQMPAFTWEVEEACKEGIKIMHSLGPKRIIKEQNKVVQIECMQVKSLFDNFGRFSPQFFPDKTTYVDCDFVVIAIGQQMDENLFKSYPIEAIKKNKFDNLYLCGDIDIGASSVVSALAEGKKLAYMLHSKFTNSQKVQQKEKLPSLPDNVVSLLPRLKRQPMPKLDICKRQANFEQVEKGYSFWAAQAEALRCLRCTISPKLNPDKCVHCLNCFRVCQNGAIEIQRNAPPNPQNCIGCGTCVSVCPNNALYWEIPLYTLDIERLSCCISDIGALKILCANNIEVADGVKVPCVTHISERDLLSLIERGAKKIEFKICGNDNCRTPKDMLLYFYARIQNLQNLLRQADIEASIDCTYS